MPAREDCKFVSKSKNSKGVSMARQKIKVDINNPDIGKIKVIVSGPAKVTSPSPKVKVERAS